MKQISFTAVLLVGIHNDRTFRFDIKKLYNVFELLYPILVLVF